jgi:ubiquitin-protein ligase
VMKFETKVWHPNVSSQTVSMLVRLPVLGDHTH